MKRRAHACARVASSRSPQLAGALIALGLLACTTHDTPTPCPVCPVCRKPPADLATPGEPEVAEPAEVEEAAEVTEPAEVEEAEVFDPTPVPWRDPTTVLAKRKRACELHALLDPESRVIYEEIDVYVALAQSLEIEHELAALAAGDGRPLCAEGTCTAGTPNPIVLDDGGISGLAIGFVVPLGDGNWVLPLSAHHRVYQCLDDIESERVADDHARITVRHSRAVGEPCDEHDDDDTECGVGCVYEGGATQYDMIYDAKDQRVLLLTRRYAKLDRDDEPTPTIAIAREDEGVRVTGCGVDRLLEWPRGFF